MSNPVRQEQEQEEEVFGKDHGLIHEAVVTGRSVGAGREFWSRLAHDKNLFGLVVQMVTNAKWLLKFEQIVKLPAIDEFRLNDIIEGGNIDGVDVVFRDNFKKVFGGRVEKDIPAETLRVNELVENSLDEPIIAELGGKEFAVVKLAQVFEFMRQKGRQSKTSWFVFYVEEDNKEDTWAVYCSWDAGDGSWDVGTYSYLDPSRWSAGGFFVSRGFDPKDALTL